MFQNADNLQQTTTIWHPYNTGVYYHGRHFYIKPPTPSVSHCSFAQRLFLVRLISDISIHCFLISLVWHFIQAPRCFPMFCFAQTRMTYTFNGRRLSRNTQRLTTQTARGTAEHIRDRHAHDLPTVMIHFGSSCRREIIEPAV
jgi:hypothetical protein